MSRILRSLVTIGALYSVVACNSSTSSVIPQPPNPTTTTITLDGASGSPLPNATVTLSTGIANHAPSGVISKQKTNGIGQVTFFNLPLNGQLCVSSSNSSVLVYYCANPFPATYTLSFAVTGG
jgi:hypothetical protein